MKTLNIRVVGVKTEAENELLVLWAVENLGHRAGRLVK